MGTPYLMFALMIQHDDLRPYCMATSYESVNKKMIAQFPKEVTTFSALKSTCNILKLKNMDMLSMIP